MIYNVASSLGQPVQKFPQCRNQFRASQTIEMEMITLNSGFEASAVLASASPVEINRITENIAMTVAVALQEIAYFNSFNWPARAQVSVQNAKIQAPNQKSQIQKGKGQFRLWAFPNILWATQPPTTPNL